MSFFNLKKYTNWVPFKLVKLVKVSEYEIHSGVLSKFRIYNKITFNIIGRSLAMIL